MPPEQQNLNNQIHEVTPIQPSPVNEYKSRLLLRIAVFIVLIIIALGAVGAFFYFKETRAITKLEDTGSAEYKAYIKSIDNINEQWLEIKAQMETDGSTQEEIQLAHSDFIEFLGSTILLKIQLGGTNLTDTEKKGVALKLAELISSDPTILDTSNICRNKEELLPIPLDLQDAILTLESSAYIAKGDDPDLCGPSFSNIQLELVSDGSINNLTIGKRYYEEQGRSVEKLSAGRKFTLEKIVSVTDRGLFNEGEIEYLILKDEQGKLYEVATVYLSDEVISNTADQFELMSKDINLSYSKNGKKLGVLSYEYFEDYKKQLIVEQTTDISFQFGKLADTTSWKTYSTSTRQYQVKYPSDWSVSPGSKVYSGDRFISPNKVYITVSIDTQYGSYNLKRAKNEALHVASTTVGKYPAIEGLMTDYGEAPEGLTFVAALTQPINGIYYRFHLVSPVKDDLHAYVPIFNSMLKSFIIK